MIGTKALQGWRIVGLSALMIGCMVTIIWLFQGINEQGMRMTLRATARTSCILFLSAFVASALRKIWPNPFSAWLLQNRRYFGVSMAVSHTYHAIAWTGLWFATSGVTPKFDPLAVLGYFFLYAMTITSFERPAAWLGKRGWKILHTAGMHFFWLAFTLEFSLKIPKSMFIYSPFVLLLIFAMMLRLIASRMQGKLVNN
jgi:methionine sulfoxide reductase heme-binding subunit